MNSNPTLVTTQCLTSDIQVFVFIISMRIRKIAKIECFLYARHCSKHLINLVLFTVVFTTRRWALLFLSSLVLDQESEVERGLEPAGIRHVHGRAETQICAMSRGKTVWGMSDHPPFSGFFKVEECQSIGTFHAPQACLCTCSHREVLEMIQMMDRRCEPVLLTGPSVGLSFSFTLLSVPCYFVPVP